MFAYAVINGNNTCVNNELSSTCLCDHKLLTTDVKQAFNSVYHKLSFFSMISVHQTKSSRDYIFRRKL